MTSSLIPDKQTRAFADQIARMEEDIAMLKRALRSSQLGNSSIEDGALSVYDGDGNLRGRVGIVDDGSFAQQAFNATPPPRPNIPELVPIMQGIGVNWNGDFVGERPADFKHLEVYRLSTATGIPGPSNFIGTIPEPGGIPDAPLASGNTYYYLFIAVNTSEKENGTGVRATASEPSLVASATPNQVVAQQVLDGIVNNLALANGAVTEAKVAAGAVTATKVADNSISTPKIIAGSIQGDRLAAATIYGSLLVVDAITTRELATLAVKADNVDANAINAGHVQAGAITASKLAVDLAIVNRIIAGTATGNRVEMHPTLGLQAFSSGGSFRTFWIDASTGNMTATGTYRTATSGPRIELNPFGNVPDEIRLWQDSTTFGLIRAEAGAGGTAAIIMRASPSGRGQVGVYGAEAYTGWFSGSETTARAAVAAQSNRTNIWGGDVFISTRQAYGNGIVEFSEDGITDSLLQYRRRSDGGGPCWFHPGESGLIFAGTALGVLGNSLTTNGPIVATQFLPPSSITLKEGVEEIVLPNDRTSWDLIEGAPSKDFYYTTEKDRDGKRGRKHRFPIAEDLAALDPSLVREGTGIPGDPSNVVVDMRDMVGILWDAVDMLIKRNRLLEAKLAQRFPLLDLPSRPQKEDVIEGIGALIAGLSKRIIDATTGQIATRPHRIRQARDM